jgi:hypothetical protein
LNPEQRLSPGELGLEEGQVRLSQGRLPGEMNNRAAALPALFARLREHGAINVVQIPRLYGFAGGALDRPFEIGLALERFMVHDQVSENRFFALCAPYAQQRHIASLLVDSGATRTLGHVSVATPRRTSAIRYP